MNLKLFRNNLKKKSKSLNLQWLPNKLEMMSNLANSQKKREILMRKSSELKLRNYISWKFKMLSYWNRIRTSSSPNFLHRSQIIQLIARMEFQLLISKMIMTLMIVHQNKSTWVMPRKKALTYQTLYHKSNSLRRKKRSLRKLGSMTMIQLLYFQ